MREASDRPGARRLLPVSTSCGCRYAWFQRRVSGASSALGCMHHSPAGSDWTRRTTAFHVEPDVTPGDWQHRRWSDGTWCRRGGGTYSQHECDRTADDHGKRCRCSCGAVE